MKTFRIGTRRVGIGELPLVIAELGINHNGDLAVAKEMVDAAAKSGAEIIKHQTHIVEDEMSDEARMVVPGNAEISIYDIMERCALSEQDEKSLMDYVQSKGMLFISTPFSRAAADRLESFDVPAYKIGSGECNNLPLVEHIAGFGKPIIVSTGMNTLDSVSETVDLLNKKNVPFALLHTTNLYPTPPHLVRLGAMQALMDSFPDTPVGLSDHTTSNLACFAATAMGACILERHFTDRMNRPGPDIINSMDAAALKELVAGTREIAAMCGGKKEPAAEEQVTMDFAFATVVAIRDIQAGEVFDEKNTWVKRPGTGDIRARDYKNVLGKTCNVSLKRNTHISWSHICE